MLPFLPDNALTFWLVFSFARALASFFILTGGRVRIIFFRCRHYCQFQGSLAKNGTVLAVWLDEIVRFSTDKGSCESPAMTIDNRMNLPGIAEFSEPVPGKPQFQKNSYARELRAVGQALEERHVFSLDLRS